MKVRDLMNFMEGCIRIETIEDDIENVKMLEFNRYSIYKEWEKTYATSNVDGEELLDLEVKTVKHGMHEIIIEVKNEE